MRTPLLASLALAAAAACGSHASTPIGNVGGPMPTGPAPTVAIVTDDSGDWGMTFEVTGLPAISNDGKAVAIAVRGEDGARGAPNLALIERDRTDAETHRLVVLTADVATMAEDAPPPPHNKVAAANAYLTESHGARGWFSLAAMELKDVDGADDSANAYGVLKTASADGYVLSWDEGKVLLTSGGKTIVDRQTQGWTAPTGVRCDGCEVCSNPSFLAGAWIDSTRKLIVARISYIGNDTCWEPDSEDHVIAW